MSSGAIVWAVIGAAWAAWLVTSSVWAAVPSIARLVRSMLGSWLGRAVALAAWAGAGWHLFCQHP